MGYRYILRRTMQAVPTLGAVLVVSFTLIHLAPGDPVRALAGEGGDLEFYERMRRQFGLDRPLLEQFVTYVGNVFRGNMGVSYLYGEPAMKVIMDFLPATLLLTGTAFVLSSLFGVGLGLFATRRPGGRFDTATNLGSLLIHATPTFVLAQVALLTLALAAGLFPSHGMTNPRETSEGFGHIVDVAHHLVLPALIVALSDLTLILRLTRASVLRELGTDYVLTASAKGLSDRRVLTHHALPNALTPVITVLGTRVGGLFAGAAVTEIVFGWPGIGRLLLTSTQGRDYPVLLGIFLLVGFALVIGNLIADLLYVRLDPRVTYG